ncbi:hypothetical protein BDC45DRAFT_536210 [Circinella umbellata]|nr:hypothetical protein BDC45DRAFT_536210 [Circinella umbellata]
MPFKRIFAEEKLGLSNAFDVARQRVISMVALNTEKLGLSNALDVARQRVISIAALNTEKLGLSDATVAMATISHMLEIIENVAQHAIFHNNAVSFEYHLKVVYYATADSGNKKKRGESMRIGL